MKKCPRCGSVFNCTVNADCDCMKLKLSLEELAYIKTSTEKTYSVDACFCSKCLLELKAGYSK